MFSIRRPNFVPRDWCLSALLLVVFITLLVFAKSAQYGFLYLDDDLYVFENPHIQDGISWASLKWSLTADFFRDDFNADYWQPVTTLSHMVVVELFGMEPSGHHLANIVIHALNAGLVFLICRRLTGRIWIGFAVALLFALHPFRVQSVVWVTERKDVLSAFFQFLGVLLYLIHHQSIQRRQDGLPIGPRTSKVGLYLCFVLGIMSKPSVVVLPGMLLLLDFWPLARVRSLTDFRDWLVMVWEKKYFVVMGALLLLFPGFFYQKQVAVSTVELGFLSYFFHTLAVHFWKTLAIFPLTVHLQENEPYLGSLPVFLAGVAGCLLLFWLVLRSRRLPGLFVSLAWFFGTLLLPVMLLIPPEDRFHYVPSVGWFLFLVLILERLASRINASYRGAVLYAVPLGLVVLFTCITRWYMEKWRDNETFWRYLHTQTETDWLVHHKLGLTELKNGNTLLAMNHLFKAIRFREGDPRVHYSLGQGYFRLGPEYHDCAIAHFSKSAGLNAPDFRSKHIQLRALFRKYAEEAIAKRNYSGAVEKFQQILMLDPTEFDAFLGLALIHAKMKQNEQTLIHLKSALKLRPDWLDGRNKIAWLMATGRDLQGKYASEACLLAEELAQETGYGNLVVLDTYAAALASCGRMDEGLKLARQNLNRAIAQERTDLIPAFTRRVRSLEEAQPIQTWGEQFQPFSPMKYVEGAG
jgi:protein O-mannosyl-transferase